MPVIDHLKKSPLFAEASAECLKQIELDARSFELSPGQSLFYEGDPSTSFFIVKSGTIIVKKASLVGDEDLARIGPGSHLGEMTLLNSLDGIYDRRTAAAEAAEPSVVIEIPFRAIEDLSAKDAQFGMTFYRAIARILSGRIQKTAEDLTSLKALRLKHV